MKIFSEHHIRANFYHIVAVAFLITTILWSFSVISDTASFIIGIVLFTTDWLAEMYDPHPDNPGTWFKSHFHRISDNTSVKVIKYILGIFTLLICISILLPAVEPKQSESFSSTKIELMRDNTCTK